MEEIVEHIIEIISREEKGSLLSYNILCNIAINMVMEGKTKDQITHYLDSLIIDVNKRKL